MKKEVKAKANTLICSISLIFLLVSSCSSVATNLQKKEAGEWKLLPVTSTLKDINTIKLLDEMRWWASTNNGLFQTKNGGLSWEQIRTNETKKTLGVNFTQSLNTLQLLNEHFGFGLDSRLMRTDDGGKTWGEIVIHDESITKKDIPVFRSFNFLDERRGWVVGESLINAGTRKIAMVWETTDAGEHWKAVECTECGEDKVFWRVTAISDDTALILGDTIYRKKLGTGEFHQVKLDLNLLSSNLIDIQSTHPSTVWAEVEAGNGYYISHDNGENWVAKKLETASKQIILTNEQQGFLLSMDGILATEDMGKRWVTSLQGKYQMIAISNDHKIIAAFGDQIAVRQLIN